MNKLLLKDSLGWGFLLWLVGYILGVVLFFVLPPALIGWVITPIGVGVTLWVLIKKIKNHTLGYYIFLGVVWSLVAMIFDYFFIVKLLKPTDGYYKLDIYIYYSVTFILPIIVGWWKDKSVPKKDSLV
jgi:hypothetical protein